MDIKIFISYGHKDSTELAMLLKKELVSRGFDVWLDSSKIRAGKEWEQQIIEGIKESQVMIALLSPHSTRSSNQNNKDDSVCLDELSWARYEPPPTTIIPILAVKGAAIPLTIHRLHYLDFIDSLSNTLTFQQKFDELLTSLDSALKGQVLYRSLETSLQPILEFDRFLYTKHRNFIGREWLFQEIEIWRTNDLERALLIVGDPGIGKSSIIAELSYGMFDGATIVTYCCQWDTKATLNPANFVKTVAYQLAVRIPEYALKIEEQGIKNILTNAEKDPASAFEQGVLTPLNSLDPPQSNLPFFICIDALDEATLFSENDNILSLLESRIERIPNWLKLIATTRNDRIVNRQFGGLRTKIIDASGEKNLQDISSYISLKIKEISKKLNIQIENQEEYIASLLEHSEGNFLYTKYHFLGIFRNGIDIGDFDNLPLGLEGAYQRYLHRAFSTSTQIEEIIPILEILCATKEPIERYLLAEASNLTERELIKRLVPLTPFLSQLQNKKEKLSISLWHKSFYDFLTSIENADSEFGIDTQKGNLRLVPIFIETVAKGSTHNYSSDIQISNYLARRGLDHLALSGRFFDGLSKKEVENIIFYSENNSKECLGCLGSFSPIFIKEAIKQKRFNDIKQMIDSLADIAEFFYIESGVIKIEKSPDGTQSKVITAKAEKSPPIYKAYSATSNAIVIANEVLSYYGDGDLFQDILKKMKDMDYMVGGFAYAYWGYYFSGLISDQAYYFDGLLSDLKKGKKIR